MDIRTEATTMVGDGEDVEKEESGEVQVQLSPEHEVTTWLDGRGTGAG